MGDVYWMSAILFIQSIVSAVICAYLTIKCECVEKVEQEKQSEVLES